MHYRALRITITPGLVTADPKVGDAAFFMDFRLDSNIVDFLYAFSFPRLISEVPTNQLSDGTQLAYLYHFLSIFFRQSSLARVQMKSFLVNLAITLDHHVKEHKR